MRPVSGMLLSARRATFEKLDEPLKGDMIQISDKTTLSKMLQGDSE